MRTEWMLRKDGATPGGKAGAAAEPGESLAMPAIIGLTSLTHCVSWTVSERSVDEERAEQLPPGRPGPDPFESASDARSPTQPGELGRQRRGKPPCMVRQSTLLGGLGPRGHQVCATRPTRKVRQGVALPPIGGGAHHPGPRGHSCFETKTDGHDAAVED